MWRCSIKLIKPRRILFARHAQTDWNDSSRYQGRTDVPLNGGGRRQAESLARRLASWKADRVLSSTLVRARETAEIVMEKMPDPPALELSEDLVELDFGEWEGMSVSEVRQRYGELYERWRDDPASVDPPKGEPFDDVIRRVNRAMSPILSSDAERVLVICHGGTIRAAVVSLLGAPSSIAWRIRIDNCALFAVDILAGRCSLAFANDALHLFAGNVRAEQIPLLP
ncbi:MAG TPA: histidine phosphatase family protein [Thermosynergistes sp.]|nr:histidine phosphatase family protein [Thermosynergistes sp.]